MYNRVTQWHHLQVAYFLGRLKRIQESGGSLLDNSMVVYGSSLSDGHAHSAEILPILLAGRGAGTIESGRHLKFQVQTSMSKLHLAVLQRAGVKATSFGGEIEPMEL